MTCPKATCHGQLILEGLGTLSDGTRVQWVSCDTCNHWDRLEQPDADQPSLFDDGGTA